MTKIAFRDCAVYNISPGCTCAFSSKVRELFLKTDSGTLPHDWKINIIAACLDGLYYLDVVTTKYRLHGDNTYGLGHKLDYDKRLKQVESDLMGKKELKKLTELYGSEDDMRYAEKIVRVFDKRYTLMTTGKIIPYGVQTALMSLGKGHLIESVVFDILSVLKG